jgi:ribonucleotide monophosphatase NagD (HAD superfamily)
MVGDPLSWDVEGALRAGYRLAILVGGGASALPRGGVRVAALDEALSRLLETA